MSRNPPIKFVAHPFVRRRLEKIAEFHGIGHNDSSANEVVKIAAAQISLIRPAKLFEALAALKPYQVTNPFALSAFGPQKPKKNL
ncbi:MAG TPA: hypothetical protein VG734_19415 [Lacunisphaera sp.]|nr:hypothetical protein [Lacunisphaera sp.]